jgi:hypothetical protein
VGATLPNRDAVDLRLIQEVQKRKGAIVPDSKGLVWPKLKSAKAPADSDNDGMPDDWEVARGLKPNNASDRNDDRLGDGYSNLEEYINGVGHVPEFDPDTEGADQKAPAGRTE